jgi:hypothetical protein
MTTEGAPRYSSRVVDRDGEGWLDNGPERTYTTYPNQNIGENLTYEELEAQRGPLRPVGPMTSEDSEALADALATAGKKGVATLLAALNRTAKNLIADGGSLSVLTAGRPGSWEASLLRGEIVWIGEDIARSRIDDAAFDVAAATLDKWVTGPVVPELADGLASILGDAAKKAGGWHEITDRWLTHNAAVEHWTSGYRR